MGEANDPQEICVRIWLISPVRSAACQVAWLQFGVMPLLKLTNCPPSWAWSPDPVMPRALVLSGS